MVAAKAGGVWAKLALVAGRVCPVEDSVRAGGKGIPKVELVVSASVASVGRDPGLSGFDSVTIFSWCEWLWLLGSSV